MRIFVGNDVVDLDNPDISMKHNEERFLRRVLCSSEYEELKRSKNKKEKLWSIWSGKEAAYKVLKKRFSDLVFAHSKFVVSFDDENNKSGFARYKDEVLSLRWTSSEEWVHCVAVEQRDEKHLEILEYDVKELARVSICTKKFNAKELRSTYSPESAGVRNLTKSLLKKHMLSDVRIIRHPLDKKFSPPELYLSEISLKNWDLSMSHDGRFVSCALSRRGQI